MAEGNDLVTLGMLVLLPKRKPRVRFGSLLDPFSANQHHQRENAPH
jgi:hypothetical protein